MEKYITDEQTGLEYELVGDYYLLAGDDKPEERRPIGIWGQRHLRYLRRCRKATYTALLIEGKLPDFLADVNEQAEEMLFQLVKQMAKNEDVDEAFKRRNQLGWVRKMNSIRNRAEEGCTERNHIPIKYTRRGEQLPASILFWKVSNDYFSSGLFTIYSLNV